MSSPEKQLQEAPEQPLALSDISPLGVTAAWNCRSVIDAVQATQPFGLSRYEAVQICCAIVSDLPSQTGFDDFVLVLPANGSSATPQKWKIPNTICNTASGSVDDAATIGEIAKAQAAEDAGIDHKECNVSLAGVFDYDIVGYPTLVVAMLIELRVDSKSMSADNRHTRPGVDFFSKQRIENMARENFEPEVLRQCILAAFRVKARRRDMDIALMLS